MKNFLIITLSLLIFSCENQTVTSEFNEIIINEALTSKIFNSDETMLNPLTLQTEHGYDNISDSTQYAINSNVIVNNDRMRKMRLTELTQINADTLELKVFESNPAYNQKLIIKIVDTTFKTEFKYILPTSTHQPNVKTLQQTLTVKSIPKKKGEIMYGELFYKGVCESGCDEEFEIKGAFKTVLQ